MRKDRFTDEALVQAKALAEVKMSDSESFSEAYDFARCQRADGSFYGIAAGKQCKKGAKAAPADTEPKKSAKERMAAAYDKRKKEGGFAPKKDKAPAKKMKTDFRKEVREGAAKRKKRDAEIVKLQGRREKLQKRYAKIKALSRNASTAKDKMKLEKVEKLAKRIGDELEKVNNQMKVYTGQ
jgi:hypothetical protein